MCVKQLKKKIDWRYGRENIWSGNVAVFLHVGLGGLPKSSLETWRWLSFPILHSMPGQDEPGWQGVGWEVRHGLSDDMSSMILKRVSDSDGSMVVWVG